MLEHSWIVGLTGGIATGKSRVAELLSELGAAVECADRIVRELQAPGAAGLAAMVARFGAQILQPSGELDRAALGARVFRDPAARRELEALLHPLVRAELARRVAVHAAAGAAVIVADIPLLFEGARDPRTGPTALPYDVVALVYASEPTQLARLVARDGLAPADAERRLRAQLPIEEKRALADVVIDNGGEWSATAAQVRELYVAWRRAGARAARPAAPPRA